MKAVYLIVILLFSPVWNISRAQSVAQTGDGISEVKYTPWRSGCPLPSMATWFWREEQFEPGGYKSFIDQLYLDTPFDLVSVSVRLPGREITHDAVHDQIKMAVEYAAKYGISVAADLDVRAARRAFESRYPDELQEMLLLREITTAADKEVETTVKSMDLSDHYTGRTTHYISLYGKLTRVYSYNDTPEGIDPATVEDITRNCVVIASSKDSVRVKIPASKKSSRACVMVSFTLLTPDVFAPHLMEFQRELIHCYADVELAGVFKDEWGFPPCFDGSPRKDQFWYSRFRAEAYAERTGNRDLLADCLLMYRGFKGKEQERQRIINHFMEMSWQRNGALEDDYYRTVKDVFGPGAVVLTHPTWWPYPDLREYMKNGLDWWAVTRDWAQTDETTPFPVRTSLAKKWDSPVWYNMYYATGKSAYEDAVWSSALAGGRINYHPLYPSELKGIEKYLELYRGELMQAESRVRLLNFISQSPLDCPVAVVFGHACTMNWAGPSYDDVGMDLVNALWKEGIPTDLIPASEIENKNMKIDKKGWICYGKQRYSVVVLYHPEFEKKSTAAFFSQAAQGPTMLYRTGNWTRDFDAEDFDGNGALPANMVACEDYPKIIREIKNILAGRNIRLQTPAVESGKSFFDHLFITPPVAGHSRLTDGTEIILSGNKKVSGDPIKSELSIKGCAVAFEARGIIAVRLDDKGKLEALAAGGLKSFKAGNFKINLSRAIDLALWKNDRDEWAGIIQDEGLPVPPQLLKITADWKKIRQPVPCP